MEKIYLDDSYLKEHEAMVESAAVRDGELWIAPDGLLFHPEGGGQPTDLGHVAVEGMLLPLAGVVREKKTHFLRLTVPEGADPDALADALGFGASVRCILDWDFRFMAMRLHTGAHAVMAALKDLVPGFVPRGMTVSPSDAAGVLRFSGAADSAQLAAVQDLVAAVVAEGRTVTAQPFASLDAARSAHAGHFRADDELQLKGAVRMILIDGFDFNPCGGTHLRNTQEIGALTLGEHVSDGGRATLAFRLAEAPGCAA